MSSLLDGLNEPQKLAVTTTEGPVLVLAGAGSGKTRALTARLAYLIQEKHVSPFHILAVTFTNKAAKEMAERVNRLLGTPDGANARLPWLGTFHSVGVKILRRNAHEIGYEDNFTIYDSDDSLALIRTITKELGLSPKQYSPQSIRSFISGAKNELIDAAEYRKYAHGYFQTIVADVFERYERSLRQAQAVDFDDLIGLPVKLFQARPEVLDRYQDLFRYILIDEYQDTNQAQYLMVKLLAAKHKNLFVVGDDAQSIYSWRGANFRNILDFERDYPGATVVKLEQNYRSTQTILDASNALIKRNAQRKDKTLWTERTGGAPITIYEAEDGRDEGEFIMTELISLQRQGYKLGDCAILYRTNAQSRALEEVCLNYSIPYHLVGAVRFYERKEVKDILSYLSFIANPKDVVSFLRLLGVPPRGIGEVSANKLKRIVIDGTDEVLPPRVVKVWGPLAAKIENWRRLKDKLSVPELIDEVVSASGYREFLLDGTPEGEARFENIKELRSVAALTDSLETFLAEVALVSDIDGLKDSENALTLMTLHSAKGLEFPVVFLVGMEEGLFPSLRGSTDPNELEEERRLCYVGLTRAKDRLYLIHAATRLIYGAIQANLPSRFISELPNELLDTI